jgi:ribonuclease HII|tara:strand:- start:6467 stop:7039 length:573 start_codon:yes stop_codon:yes gene_type:complete
MLKQYFSDYIECGTDEAGRGCLAGPVTAAAVILPKDFKSSMLNDSKVLSIKKRKTLRDIIIKNAIDYSISHVSVKIIDEINILNASILAMNLAIEKLKIKPEFIIVDGNRFESKKKIPYSCIVKGDSKYMSIAAASILAKTSRDEYMIKLSRSYPEYDWIQNKGYPTKIHKKAILKNDITIHHRKTFKLD